ncbi:hypothetical protein GCM10010495_79880 [Kitasatospora herbaricolor]|uniref:hypothetical protein n=1 Tax=Kitasatospora herbaricolor TaxID=68217 RepID=UPI00174C39AF|nr:hypothetical protein [Kitasatospora herbaricolor]MDQ0313453.1 hypothetical protein [Kitasatospora herbaricolor]GGV50212.1 hypothetical protein GCM10010495_79880 [Kitasatospora herbaricolor]
MYVRTIYLTGDPALADGALEGLKAKSVQSLSGQAGYRGFSIFSDRRLGKILLGSWWESAQNERDSWTALHERRQELLSVFGGTVTVGGWEAAVFRRGDAQPGAGFRLVRLAFDPAAAGRLVETFEASALPGLESLEGFSGGALLIDRARGTGSVGAIFRDRAALEASRGPQAQLRSKVAQASGVQVQALEEFDVELLHRP